LRARARACRCHRRRGTSAGGRGGVESRRQQWVRTHAHYRWAALVPRAPVAAQHSAPARTPPLRGCRPAAHLHPLLCAWEGHQPSDLDVVPHDGGGTPRPLRLLLDRRMLPAHRRLQQLLPPLRRGRLCRSRQRQRHVPAGRGEAGVRRCAAGAARKKIRRGRAHHLRALSGASRSSTDRGISKSAPPTASDGNSGKQSVSYALIVRCRTVLSPRREGGRSRACRGSGRSSSSDSSSIVPVGSARPLARHPLLPLLPLLCRSAQAAFPVKTVRVLLFHGLRAKVVCELCASWREPNPRPPWAGAWRWDGTTARRAIAVASSRARGVGSRKMTSRRRPRSRILAGRRLLVAGASRRCSLRWSSPRCRARWPVATPHSSRLEGRKMHVSGF